MKHRSLFLFISAVIHGLLILIFYLFVHTKSPAEHQVRLLFEIEKTPQPVIENESSTSIPPSASDRRTAVESTILHEILKPFSWNTLVYREKKKAEEFISKPSNKTPAEAPIPLWKDVQFEPLTVPRTDPVADQLKKQEMGNVLLAAPRTEMATREKISPQFDFIPTEAQVLSMQQLYEKGDVTQMELYPSLRLSCPITAEDYNKSLKMLVEKGFVTRKKISPQNILYVMGVPVELSSRNRRNPIYLYKANVNKNKIINYLQAKSQQLKDLNESFSGDSSKIRIMIEDLERSVQILKPQSNR